MVRRKGLAVLSLVVLAGLLAGCTAGDPRFSEADPAGFFMGVWHGLISCITLIVGIFADSVHVYEVDNSGGWYDFGFLIGVSGLGGGGTSGWHRRGAKRRQDKEWEEIGQKVEAKLKRKIRTWAEAEPNEDWDVVETKAEDKLKRRLREWAETP